MCDSRTAVLMGLLLNGVIYSISSEKKQGST